MAIITGTTGADNLVGTSGDDIIDPLIAPQGTTETIDGGAGFDTLKLADSQIDWYVAVNYTGGTSYTAKVGGLHSSNLDYAVNFVNIERLEVPYVDVFYFEFGNPGIQEIIGQDYLDDGRLATNAVAANDFITVVESETSYGYGTVGRYDDANNQTYQLYFENFRVFETGDGNDDVRIAALPGDNGSYVGYVADLGAGRDTVSLSSKSDYAYGGDDIDSIVGMGGNDDLRGERGDDVLYGGTGADRLFGNSGEDQLFGEEGDDGLNGGAGSDRIYGGTGNDRIVGGGASSSGPTSQVFGDYVEGGAGNDTITFSSLLVDRVYFAEYGSQHADTISGFRPGSPNRDQVLLENSGFVASLAEGGLDASNFVSRAFSTNALDADDYFIFSRLTDTLWFDADGSGNAYSPELICDFTNDLNLTAANILIV